MKHLTIIGTSHEEKSQTTVDDLVAAIGKINPDVIFEEVPVDINNL